MPEQGANYNGYLIRVGGCEVFARLLPNCKADVTVPRRKIFLGITLFDADALKLMFEFVGAKLSHHIYAADPKLTKVRKCRSRKPSTGH